MRNLKEICNVENEYVQFVMFCHISLLLQNRDLCRFVTIYALLRGENAAKNYACGEKMTYIRYGSVSVILFDTELLSQ